MEKHWQKLLWLFGDWVLGQLGVLHVVRAPEVIQVRGTRYTVMAFQPRKPFMWQKMATVSLAMYQLSGLFFWTGHSKKYGRGRSMLSSLQYFVVSCPATWPEFPPKFPKAASSSRSLLPAPIPDFTAARARLWMEGPWQANKTCRESIAVPQTATTEAQLHHAAG